MGPKSASSSSSGASKKQEQKRQEKVIEDKTFGLKNKNKSTKVQKYVQQVTQQVKTGGLNARKLERLEVPKVDKKELERQKIEELKELFKPVVEVPKSSNQDPKTILCAFFKQGLCTRGSKCKFSHDMNSAAGANERKSEKKNLYEDDRAEDTMEDWDDATLRSVVEKRHGEAEKSKPKTDIVCKFFLDAVEQKKYGWFWECPNGNDKCHYKHALPPGFVLKSEQKKKKEDGEEITLEDLIEKERALLPPNQTKLTLETFNEWKERKKNEKKKLAEDASSKKKETFQAGKLVGLSGRDLFDFNPELARNDENEEEGEVVMVELDSDDEEAAEAEMRAIEEEEQRQRDEELRRLRAEDEDANNEDQNMADREDGDGEDDQQNEKPSTSSMEPQETQPEAEVLASRLETNVSIAETAQ